MRARLWVSVCVCRGVSVSFFLYMCVGVCVGGMCMSFSMHVCGWVFVCVLEGEFLCVLDRRVSAGE